MIDRSTIETLFDNHVDICVSAIDGTISLKSFDEVERYVKDADQFCADWHGVSKAHFLAWHDHIENCRCHALTKKGAPCSIMVNRIDRPKAFDPVCDIYCWMHSGV